jgi:Uma2 family endonuclease
MLSALSSTSTEESLPHSIPVSAPETLPYGWRYRLRRRRDGTQYYQEIPLTEADFLDPKEGYRKMQNPKHARCTVELFNRLDNYYAADPTTGVFFDLKMEWGIPGLKNPAPDISVIPHLRQKDIDPGTFKVKKQGTRPSLVIEVMSPHYQGDDTVKVELYSHAGIKEYLIVNPYGGDQHQDYHLTGYRLVGLQYEPIEPDREGRLWSDSTGVFFGVSADNREILLTTANGEKLRTAKEEKQARVVAEERAKAEVQARLEAEMKLHALEARLRELEGKPKKGRRS